MKREFTMKRNFLLITLLFALGSCVDIQAGLKSNVVNLVVVNNSDEMVYLANGESQFGVVLLAGEDTSLKGHPLKIVFEGIFKENPFWIPWCNANNRSNLFVIITKSETLAMCDENWGTIAYFKWDTNNKETTERISLTRYLPGTDFRTYKAVIDKDGKVTFSEFQ